MAIAPINYTTGVINPLQAMIGGIGQAQQLQANDQQMALQQRQAQMQEAQMAMQNAAREDMARVFSNPEATEKDIAGLISRYPAMAEMILKPWQAMGEAKQASAARSLGQIYTMLDSGNVDMALERIDERMTAAEKSGDTQELNELRVYRKMIERDPVMAKNFFRATGSIVAPDIFGKLDSGGSGPFEGTGMKAQAANILLTGDPASPEYAAAYSIMGEPTFDMTRQQMIYPDMSAYRSPAGRGGGGQTPTVADPSSRVQSMRTPGETAAATETTRLTLRQIDELANNPAVRENLGFSSLIPNRPGGEAADAAAQMQQMQGKAFLQAFEMLKGGGQITEREGAAASAAMSRMQAVVENRGSVEAYMKALNEFREQVLIGARKLGVDVDGLTGEGASEGAGQSPATPEPKGGAKSGSSWRQWMNRGSGDGS